MQRPLEILKDNSGLSFIFVLGAMLFLMSIGGSVLAAAGASLGFSLKQNEYNQIMILDESIHKNILYSLQRNPKDENLSAKLVMAMYDAKTSDSALAAMPLEIGFDDGTDLTSGGVTVKSIMLYFPRQDVVVSPAKPALYTADSYDDAGGLLPEATPYAPREPRTAVITATMEVVVEIDANGKISTTGATYEYTGGRLTDDPDNSRSGDDGSAEYPMEFAGSGHGVWRLSKHENITSKN